MQEDFLNNWEQCNKVTIDIIKSIPDESCYLKPFNPRFKSFNWEFACLITTREKYINGILKGMLNGNTYEESMDNIEKLTKKEIIKKLEDTNKEIIKIIKNEKIKEIKFFGNKTNKFSIISWLMQHEQLHYGKLMLYMAEMKIKRPKSFKEMWGI